MISDGEMRCEMGHSRKQSSSTIVKCFRREQKFSRDERTRLKEETARAVLCVGGHMCSSVGQRLGCRHWRSASKAERYIASRTHLVEKIFMSSTYWCNCGNETTFLQMNLSTQLSLSHMLPISGSAAKMRRFSWSIFHAVHLCGHLSVVPSLPDSLLPPLPLSKSLLIYYAQRRRS